MSDHRPRIQDNPRIRALDTILNPNVGGGCDHCGSQNVHADLVKVNGQDRAVHQCQDCLTTWAATRR